MTFMRALSWRWRPALFRADDYRAPYRTIIHIGPVLIFIRRRL
jgi:hypothetical protein